MNFKRTMSRIGAAAKGYGGISGATIALFIAVLVIFNAAFYALATRYSWYAYTTPSYQHSIGDTADSYFSGLDTEGRTVKIRFCKQADELDSDVITRLAHDTAKQLAERYDYVELDYINIILSPDEVAKYLYTTDPETGDRVETGESISSDTIIFDSGDRYMVQPLANFYHLDSSSTILAYNGEEVMLSMVHWVLTEEHKTVYFTSNHGETSGASFYNLLVCAGYRVEMIDLTLQDIPSDAAMIVVSNPQYDFKQAKPGSGIVAELDKLESYLAGGGHLFVAIDPLIGELPHLDDMLERWGMTRDFSTVRDVSDSVSSDGLTLLSRYASGGTASAISSMISDYTGDRVLLREVSPIKLTESSNGATAESLLVSAPGASSYYMGEQVSSSGNYVLAALSENAAGGSIFYTSGIYMTAQDLLRSNGYANAEFLYAVLAEMTGIDVPLGCTSLEFDNQSIEGLTMGVVHTWSIILIGVIPIAVLILGNVIRIRRKNR